MEHENDSIETKILEIFKKLPPQRQEQILDFIEFLVWKEQKPDEKAGEI